MIVEREQNVTMKSTIGGRKIPMTVDTSNMQHIMSILTDLYSDPEYACLREYLTNAWDAHVEAGNTNTPVELVLPNALSPFLRIRDYGVGLDWEGIESIYSQYGASTKRATNDQNGCLGLGCKAALTYTNQFSLVARKDGKCTTVSVTRDENGVGSMTNPQVVDTDDPNGVEVVIPVKANHGFEDKARKFLRAWDPATILVNGKAPESYDGLKVSDNMVVVEGDTDYVVMGNVPYPVTRGKISHGLRGRYALVAFVKIGEVNFPPNREALMYTPRTNTTLQRIGQEFRANIGTAIQRQMDAADTPGEAIQTMVRWHGIAANQASSGHVYTYKGQDVPSNFTAPRIVLAPKEASRYRRSYYSNTSQNTGREVQDVAPHQWPTTLFVYGWDMQKVSADQRRKLVKWATDKGIDQAITRFAFVKDKPTLPWLEHVVDYAEIKAIRLTPTQISASSGRIPGSYDLWDAGAWCYGKAADEIDQSRPVFYAGNGRDSGDPYKGFLLVRFPDCYIVGMPSTRVNKFKRNFPKAKSVSDAVREAYAVWKKNVHPDTLMALAMSDAGFREGLRKLDPARVDDPEVVLAATIARRDTKAAWESRKAFQRFMGHLDISMPVCKNPLDRYPLYVDCYRKANMEHVYIYMNAVYAANRKGA